MLPSEANNKRQFMQVINACWQDVLMPTRTYLIVINNMTRRLCDASVTAFELGGFVDGTTTAFLIVTLLLLPARWEPRHLYLSFVNVQNSYTYPGFRMHWYKYIWFNFIVLVSDTTPISSIAMKSKTQRRDGRQSIYTHFARSGKLVLDVVNF